MAQRAWFERTYPTERRLIAAEAYPKTKALELWPDQFKLLSATAEPPRRCEVHVDPATGRSVCFRAENYAVGIYACEGVWGLTTPIDIASFLPGTNRVVETLSVGGYYVLGWGTWVVDDYNVFSLIGPAGEKIWESPNIEKGHPSWVNSLYTIKKSVEVSSLDVQLWQRNSLMTGYIDAHISGKDGQKPAILTFSYLSTVPPTYATVELDVLDLTTGAGIPDASVYLIAGMTVKHYAKTDSMGHARMENVEADNTYTLRIVKSGYLTLETTLTVTAPTTYPAPFNLAPSPVPPPPPEIPWEWIVMLGGIAFVGALMVWAFKK